MKKLLAILGSTTLAVSTGATAVACAQTLDQPVDLSKFNNSLANMQGLAAAMTKQLILGDQFNLSVKNLDNQLGDLSAKEVVESTTGLTYDANDFNLNESSDLTSLNAQYFEKLPVDDTTKNINIKTEGDVHLDGKIGLENDQLWNFLKDSLGVDLGQIPNLLDAALSFLSGMNGWSLQDILKSILPGLNLDEILSGLDLGINHTLLEAVSWICDYLFKDPQFVGDLTKTIANFDIGTNYSEMKVGDITSAAMISLSNAIVLFVQPDYQAIELTSSEASDSNKIATALTQSGSNLGTVLGETLFPTGSNDTTSKKTFDLDFFKNDLKKDATRYVKAVANLFQFLEFFQFQFSLFDDTKDVQPTDADHLFSNDPELTNKKYLQQILGSGKTLRESRGLPEGEKLQGSLNLKYLLSIFKNTFKSLDNPDDQNGYSFQKFLVILFLGTKDVNIDQWKDSMASPFSAWTTQIISQILFQFLKNNLNVDLKDIAGPLLKSYLNPFLTTFLEQLLTGKSLEKPVTNLVEGLLNLLTIKLIINAIPDENIQKILEAISEKKEQFIAGISQALDKIPLLHADNGWQELYSGDPLKMDGLIESLKELQKSIGSDENLDSLFETLNSGLGSVNDALNNFLPNGEKMNLKNLLITPLNEINNHSSVILPPAFGDYYLSKSINEIINDLCETLEITGEEKLNDDNLKIFDFKLSSLNDLLQMVVHYNYRWEEEPEEDVGVNLISILFENPDKLAEILGLKEDGTIGKGSLLDWFFNDLLKVNEVGKSGDVSNDPFKFLMVLLTSIFNNLNSPNMSHYQETYKKLFSGNTQSEDQNDFAFSYQEPVQDDDGALLGQIVVVKYHNPENNTNWTYTLNYSREKVSDRFAVRLFKKDAA